VAFATGDQDLADTIVQDCLLKGLQRPAVVSRRL
jgi:RNA polymerase sigma-70 factor (ECF subfamily)